MELDEIKRVRLAKLDNLKGEGINPYGGRFPLSGSIAETLRHFAEEKEVVLA